VRKYLFIGGCADGQRYEVPADATYWVCQATEGLFAKPWRSQYRRERLASDNIEFHIFVEVSLTTADALGMLIDHYLK
jgi:hypothetical protein